MQEPLAIHVHDHLAGSAFAIDLVESLRDHHSTDSLSELASSLLIEIKRDREVLQSIADRVGKGTPDVKEAVAWAAEKVSRFKLSHNDSSGLGTFQAFESVALGILGKLALWRTLAVLAHNDDRLRGFDFETLIARAQQQHSQVEECRLALAGQVFEAPRPKK